VSDAPRNRRPLFALLTANVVSMVGNMMTIVAVPWFVLETTGSAAKTGITAFFTALPAVLSFLFGGTLVDRLGFKPTSVLADVFSGVSVLGIPLLHVTVGIEFWQLLVLVFLGALFDAPGVTARASLVPDLAGLARIPLHRASAMSDGTNRASSMLGPPIAGLLIGFFGPANVLFVDAATFAVSALIVALFLPGRGPQPKNEERHYMREMREGLSFIRNNRLMLILISLTMLTNLLDAALGSVVYPVYMRSVFDSAVALGLLFGIFGAGALTASIVYGWIGERLPQRIVFIGGFTLVAGRVLMLAAYPPLWVILSSSFVFGLGAGALNPMMATMDYKLIPPEMRGRVLGVGYAGSYLGMPLGGLLGGFLIEGIGLTATLLVVGGIYVMATTSLALSPTVRNLDDVFKD
jgi:MFS family permease